MSKDYWKASHDQALLDYARSTSTCEKNAIYEKQLHKAFEQIATRALTSLRIHPTAELKQDIVIHLLYRVVPKLSEDRIKAAMQYLWFAALNFIRTNVLTPKRYQVVSLDTVITSDKEGFEQYSPESFIIRNYTHDPCVPYCEQPDLDAPAELAALRKHILDELEFRLKGQKIANATNSVYVMLLKQYILDNDFDVRGFGPYVIKAMHLKITTCRAISARLGFRTLQFNEPLEKKKSSQNKSDYW